MPATRPDPARSGATGVDHGVAGHSVPGGGVPSGVSPGVAGPPPRPPQPGPSAAPTASGDADQDWPAQTADAIQRVVAAIRAKTAEPLERLARGLVYGLVAAVVGVAAAVLAAVALVRVLDTVLPGAVWSAHALAGGIFTIGGLLLWRKRTVKTVKV
jgi:hypothetical protein